MFEMFKYYKNVEYYEYYLQISLSRESIQI